MSGEDRVFGKGVLTNGPGESLSWHRTWILALAKPSVSTFARIARDPNATMSRGYVWVFFGALVGEVLHGLLVHFFGGLQNLDSTTIASICVPVNIVFAVLSFALVAWVTQAIVGRLFRGGGSSERLVYAFAAFYAPLYIISNIFVGIAPLSCLATLAVIYELFLGVTAVKAVHGIGWGQSAVSLIGSLVILMGFSFVLTVCTMVVLGPDAANGILQLMSGSGYGMP